MIIDSIRYTYNLKDSPICPTRAFLPTMAPAETVGHRCTHAQRWGLPSGYRPLKSRGGHLGIQNYRHDFLGT